VTDAPSGAGPAVRLADRLRRLTGWRRWGAAILAGAFASLSLPPADILPVLWIAVPALLWLMDDVRSRKGAFAIGWCFGFGYLAASLYWLTFALFVAIDRYWWLVPFASNGLAAGLAPFWGLATLATARIPPDRPFARAVLLVAALTLTEWLRGHVLTGFPWNLPGYAWADYPWLAQSAAAVGAYGMTALALLAPALAAPLGSRFATPGRAGRAALGGLVLVAVIAFAGFLRLPAQPTPVVPGVRLRLVQPSIPQSLKWEAGREQDNFRRHLALTELPAEKRPNVVIWPETAIPFPLDADPDLAKALGSLLPQGGLLVTGTLRPGVTEDGKPTFRNSVEALDPDGRIVARFDKFHYVPFGEYMPLKRWLPFLSAVAAGEIEPTAGPGPVTLALPGLPPASPIVCYEAIFPHAVADESRRPGWLINVTNDAWFGFSAGPYQHFAMARMRAVEEGIPLVRAANDGISAVVDPYGRIVEKLGLGAVGVLDSDLPQAIGPTLYVGWGDAPAFMMICILGAIGLAAGLFTTKWRPAHSIP
jgi:apolipoprotein N-acyltransferase